MQQTQNQTEKDRDSQLMPIEKQQIPNRTENARKRSLTPIEQLISDKIDLEKRCRTQEKKLNNDFTYIQNNATSLLLSGVSTLFFPSPKTTKNATGKQTVISSGAESDNTTKSPLSVSDYFTIAKSLLPVAWEIVQPMIIAWGVKKAKLYILGLFTSKKSSPLRK